MKTLKHILEGVDVLKITGNPNLEISRIDFDSRKVTTKSLFVAVKGVAADGHQFIDKAIQNGAKVIVGEEFSDLVTPILVGNLVYVKVKDSAEALGQMAANFYNHPSREIQLVGVTGTNGKTTTATLLYDLFTNLGNKVGLISTVENRIGNLIIPSTHTTPNALALQGLLREMVNAGCEYAFMEVSSHAVHQRRIAGTHFTGGVFTNISHDHLNYHGTFAEYIRVKKQFFDELPKGSFALTNLDDKRGSVMLQNTVAKKQTYGLKKMADYKAKIVENSIRGLQMELNGKEFFARLVGAFNAYNLLCVFATAMLLDQDEMEVMTILSNLKSAEGRFDFIYSKEKNITAIVDYAHTPDALEKVLSTIQKVRTGKEKVITVVGCGGDRDKTKRPIMAKAACDYSDQVILTSDNPRTEDPDAILADMEKGIPAYATQKALTITDRKQAIKAACQMARHGDIILVAGKGHEKYQEINGKKFPFDDKQILKEMMGLQNGSRA